MRGCNNKNNHRAHMAVGVTSKADQDFCRIWPVIRGLMAI